MYEKLDLCPSCKFTQFDTFRIVQDHSISGESFALVKCPKCGLVFTNPRPDDHSLPSYYQSVDYISHADKANNLINLIYKIVRLYTTRQKLNLINKLGSKGSLFDFGCGTGHFLHAAKKNHWAISGMEPNPQAQTSAEQILKSPIYSSIEELKSTDQFSIITAWHVLEHVSSLNDTMRFFGKHLKNNGHLLIALPNYRSYDSHVYQEFWAGYDVPRHLYHFDQESAEKLFVKHKFKLVKTLPMKFDSYYVSLLSEKYKSTYHRKLHPLKVGFESNRRALKTGEFSSLIYLLRK